MAMTLEEKIAGYLANTRQNFRARDSKAFALGDTLRWELPKTGLLSRAWLEINGTLTLTDADASMTLKDTMDGRPFGMVPEVRVTMNGGAEPVKSPLYHLFVRQLVSARSQFPDVVPAADNDELFVVGNPVYQFSTNAAAGGTANAVNAIVELPIGLDERNPLGLILLQNPDTVATVEIDTATAQQMFNMVGADAVAWNGKATLILELMSVPENADFLPPITKLHKLKYYRQAIATVGDNVHNWTPGNILLRSIERVILNGVRAGFTDVTRLGIVAQDGITKDDMPYRFQLYLQRMRYGRDLPKGVHVHDFSFQGVPGLGGTRDWIDTAELTQLHEVVTINDAAVLGQNNNFLERLVEELQPLQTQ